MSKYTITELATLWAMYNSRSGKASTIQIDRISKQFNGQTDSLERMLTERRIDIAASIGR